MKEVLSMELRYGPLKMGEGEIPTKEEFLAWVGECWDKTTEQTRPYAIVGAEDGSPTFAIVGPGPNAEAVAEQFTAAWNRHNAARMP